VNNQPLSIAEIRIGIRDVLSGYSIHRAAVFGSYARGEATEKSDLDGLVEPRGRVSLLHLIDIQLALEDRFQLPVDIVTFRSLNQSKMGGEILREALDVYEQDAVDTRAHA